MHSIYLQRFNNKAVQAESSERESVLFYYTDPKSLPSESCYFNSTSVRGIYTYLPSQVMRTCMACGSKYIQYKYMASIQKSVPEIGDHHLSIIT